MEFVGNTQALMSVLKNGHKKFHPHEPSYERIRSKLKSSGVENKKRLINYRTLCREVSPCMHSILMSRNPSPKKWYEGRLSYTHSAAVTSMTGYVVGLGDRHLGNVLLDSATSELVRSKSKIENVALNQIIIIVKIILIGSFFYYRLLYNHSFKTNPNSTTNLSKLLHCFLRRFSIHFPGTHWFRCCFRARSLSTHTWRRAFSFDTRHREWHGAERHGRRVSSVLRRDLACPATQQRSAAHCLRSFASRPVVQMEKISHWNVEIAARKSRQRNRQQKQQQQVSIHATQEQL